MPKKEDDADLPLENLLRNRSLDDPEILRATEATTDYPILPWVNVVKIGGQSIMDRGRAAVYPLVEEIVANLGRHKMILGTGAGTRARHIYSLAIDLGLPTGVLTVLGTAVAWQNAQMLHYLLARSRHPVRRAGGLQHPPPLPDGAGRGRLPGHAAVQALGAEPRRRPDPPATHRHRLLPDRRGLRRAEDDLRQGRGRPLHADPKKDPSAAHIPRIALDELLARDLDDLVVERAVLELMANARHIREIQFVNGLKPGQLTAALEGEPVGTIIYRERPDEGRPAG